MTEMIERARLAVVEVIQSSDLPAGTYIDSEKIVRAVIEAMREPTSDMKWVARASPENKTWGEVDDLRWRAMIDAALGVQSSP